MPKLEAEDIRRLELWRPQRQQIVAFILPEAWRYGSTVTTLLTRALQRTLRPRFQREYERFIPTLGLPRDQVKRLVQSIIDREDVTTADLMMLLQAYEKDGVLPSREHAAEIRRWAQTLETQAAWLERRHRDALELVRNAQRGEEVAI